MKITIGSPDGLGDFVLRMPLVEALLAAGHDLQIIMRPPAADLARELFPDIEVLVLERDPYHAETKKRRQPFRREIAGIRRFAPDLYVASAFQLNFFDEVFLRQNSDIRSAGFSTEDAFWPSDTSVDPRELAARFAPRVCVPTAMPEAAKNRQLAEALTGNPPLFAKPRQPNRESLEEARKILQEHGLCEREFVIVCAGNRPGLVMKDWGEGNWAALLQNIGKDTGMPFVFLGNPKESASVARLDEALPPDARGINLAGSPPPVSVSYALISLAAAYLGRDSGLMHLAAVAGIPLLAVFAGGHWPRFLPEAARGIILTRAASCRGCNFYCPFPEPWCVKTVPVEEVARAWRDLPAARDLRTIELPSGEQWLSMTHELDVPSFIAEQAAAARAAVREMVHENVWRRMLGAMTA